MKRLVGLVILFAFVIGTVIIADVNVTQAAMGGKSLLLTDADNKVCPVTGKEITQKKFNTGYKGKRYWFFSYDAVKEFKKNPEQYLRNVSSY